MAQCLNSLVSTLTGGQQVPAMIGRFNGETDPRKREIKRALLVRLTTDQIEGLLTEKEIAEHGD